eukprot:scaffold26372_cov120-Isochrysis_galbana.AAC.4
MPRAAISTGAPRRNAQMRVSHTRAHRIERRSVAVKAAEDEGGRDVTLILEQLALEHRHRGDGARRLARGQAVQLDLRRDELCGCLSVGRRAGTAAPDVVCDVMNLLAVLIAHGLALGGARVGAQNHAILHAQPRGGCCERPSASVSRTAEAQPPLAELTKGGHTPCTPHPQWSCQSSSPMGLPLPALPASGSCAAHADEAAISVAAMTRAREPRVLHGAH